MINQPDGELQEAIHHAAYRAELAIADAKLGDPRRMADFIEAQFIPLVESRITLAIAAAQKYGPGTQEEIERLGEQVKELLAEQDLLIAGAWEAAIRVVNKYTVPDQFQKLLAELRALTPLAAQEALKVMREERFATGLREGMKQADAATGGLTRPLSGPEPRFSKLPPMNARERSGINSKAKRWDGMPRRPRCGTPKCVSWLMISARGQARA